MGEGGNEGIPKPEPLPPEKDPSVIRKLIKGLGGKLPEKTTPQTQSQPPPEPPKPAGG